MDEVLKSGFEFHSNARRFQRSLERIAEKYSKMQYDSDAIEVNLNDTSGDALQRYMTLSKKNLDKWESMSLADLREESLQDITRDSAVDYTCKEKSGFETTSLSEVTQNDDTQYTGVLDESKKNYTLLSDQPEDQDEELEVSLQSQGSSLGDRYPNMVSQIEKAWRRQHASEAADSVRRRYQKWRKSSRMHRTNTSHVAKRHNLETSKRELFAKHHHALKSPVNSVASTMTTAVSPSPVKTVTLNGQKSQYYCSPMRSEAPVVVMDMPAIYKESERVINKTFTMSGPSVNYSSFTSSSSRSCYSPNKPFQDFTFRMKESGMSPRHIQTASSSVHGSTLPKELCFSPVRASPFKPRLTSMDSINEWIDIYGSPLRKNPFELHTSRESPRESPHAQAASPKSPYMKHSFSKVLKSSNSASNFVPSSSKLAVPRRTLEYPDQHVFSQQWSPQLARPRRQHHGLRRHLSFDSSTQPLSRPSYSSKKFDEDFVKLYHKLVCLNKSSFLKGHPCRFCANNSEAGRGHSFNLAALALSPHRPLLRKRHGDLQSYPHSKRFRNIESYC